MSESQYVIGVDFGTDSVRAMIVDACNGENIATSVFEYPRWKTGLYCDPGKNMFRQHPLDYLEGLEYTIKDCLHKSGDAIAKNIKALSVDTTGSTPVPVDKNGTPLAMLEAFCDNPNAMFILWKDHTAIEEAAQINEHAKKFEINYLKYVGGIYSSEWYWAKALHMLRTDQLVRHAVYTFVEHCDWIPFILTGGKEAASIKRSVCAAGHKALWSGEWNGFPPNDFFYTLHPLLNGFVERIQGQCHTSDNAAGKLCKEWAQRLGLNEEVLVGVGAFDAHMGAVGGQVEPYHLSKIMGTSTCDILVTPAGDMNNKLIRGICGQVMGSVIPGMVGLEAGQSAFGDVFAWTRTLLNAGSIDQLSDLATNIPLQEDDELAVDWLNGRRTPDANQELKAAIINLNLATDAPRLFKAMVEAACFGARSIIDRFREEGIPVNEVIGLGGVARKSPYIMQVMADVLQMPVKIHRSEQTCAMGAAMFAATVAGVYRKVEHAMSAMGHGFDRTYQPDASRSGHYKNRYLTYKQLGKFVEL